MDLDKRAFRFTHDCKSHRGYTDWLDNMQRLEPCTDERFSMEGKTYRVLTCYGRPHVKEVQCSADSPVLAWAQRNRKRITAWAEYTRRLHAGTWKGN